jgi:hypothetical protein
LAAPQDKEPLVRITPAQLVEVVMQSSPVVLKSCHAGNHDDKQGSICSNCPSITLTEVRKGLPKASQT